MNLRQMSRRLTIQTPYDNTRSRRSCSFSSLGWTFLSACPSCSDGFDDYHHDILSLTVTVITSTILKRFGFSKLGRSGGGKYSYFISAPTSDCLFESKPDQLLTCSSAHSMQRRWCNSRRCLSKRRFNLHMVGTVQDRMSLTSQLQRPSHCRQQSWRRPIEED